MKINRAAVIGTGTMGPGIAAMMALGGCEVTLVGERADWAEEGVARARATMDQLLANDLATRNAVECGKGKLAATTDLGAAVSHAQLVVEAVYEDLTLKQEMFGRLDHLAGPGTILASNTSGLSITAICAQAIHRERIATTHFWNPPHLVPLVEVVKSPYTSEETAQTLLDFLKGIGKQPVLVRKDLPGQLANRIFQAMIREATHLVDEGVATPEDVDAAIKNGLGIRLPVWGVIEHIDAVGLDMCLEIQKSVLPSLNNNPYPVAAFEGKVRDGQLGVKSGSGFYDWSTKSIAELKQLRDDFIIQTLHFRAQSESRKGS